MMHQAWILSNCNIFTTTDTYNTTLIHFYIKKYLKYLYFFWRGRATAACAKNIGTIASGLKKLNFVKDAL